MHWGMSCQKGGHHIFLKSTSKDLNFYVLLHSFVFIFKFYSFFVIT